MPAKDLDRDLVRNALIEEGWTITHDPLFLPYGKKDMYVDLGAERLMALAGLMEDGKELSQLKLIWVDGGYSGPNFARGSTDSAELRSKSSNEVKKDSKFDLGVGW